MKITAAIVHEVGGDFSFEEVDLAEPKDDEILVKLAASGICHTDDFGRSADISIPMPLVLGHEGAGIVEKIGSRVRDFQPGDHVAFSYAFCDHCNNCLCGEPYYCDNYNEINFGGVSGDGTSRLSQNGKPVSMFFGQSSFATHSVINNKSAVKVDKDMDLAYVAPMGCGVQTGAGTVLNVLKARPSDSLAVFGCGAVGMSAIMAAKVAHCKTIIAVGGNKESLELARELGATHTINRKEVEGITAAIMEITGKGVSFAIDTSGNERMIMSALHGVKYHGTFIPLSPEGKIKNFDMGVDVLMNMRTIKGVCEGDSIAQSFIPELVALYKKGLFPIDKIIKKYKFTDLEHAFQESRSGKAIKAVVEM